MCWRLPLRHGGLWVTLEVVPGFVLFFFFLVFRCFRGGRGGIPLENHQEARVEFSFSMEVCASKVEPHQYS